MIQVRHLTKLYGDFAAVKDISFEIEDGTICGFLGPNGAGKSTTLNILTGYTAPTEGEVLIDGRDILKEAEEARRSTGFLPEIPPVYPDLTVYEYLSFAAQLKGIKKREREEEVRFRMEQLNLTEVKDRLIRNLSKGFRQRVGFAGALLGDPGVLILDEPMAGLDPKQILETRELIRSLKNDHTVILSSHILSEVSEICDRVLIISEGEIVAADTPEHLESTSGAGTVLCITASGSLDRVLSAVRTVTEVREDNVTESEGGVQVRVRLRDGEDLRLRLSEALFAAGCPILEMKQEKADLENIFLMLTDETGSGNSLQEDGAGSGSSQEETGSGSSQEETGGGSGQEETGAQKAAAADRGEERP